MRLLSSDVDEHGTSRLMCHSYIRVLIILVILHYSCSPPEHYGVLAVHNGVICDGRFGSIAVRQLQCRLDGIEYSPTSLSSREVYG